MIYIESLLKRMSLNRIEYAARKLSNDKKIARNKEGTAIILSYESSTGMYIIQKVDGSTLFARAITNSSELGIGNQVSLAIPANGIAVIDAIPTS